MPGRDSNDSSVPNSINLNVSVLGMGPHTTQTLLVSSHLKIPIFRSLLLKDISWTQHVSALEWKLVLIS